MPRRKQVGADAVPFRFGLLAGHYLGPPHSEPPDHVFGIGERLPSGDPPVRIAPCRCAMTAEATKEIRKPEQGYLLVIETVWRRSPFENMASSTMVSEPGDIAV